SPSMLCCPFMVSAVTLAGDAEGCGFAGDWARTCPASTQVAAIAATIMLESFMSSPPSPVRRFLDRLTNKATRVPRVDPWSGLSSKALIAKRDSSRRAEIDLDESGCAERRALPCDSVVGAAWVMSTRLLTSGEGEPHTTAHRPVSLAPRATGSAIYEPGLQLLPRRIFPISPPGSLRGQRTHRNPLKSFGSPFEGATK